MFFLLTLAVLLPQVISLASTPDFSYSDLLANNSGTNSVGYINRLNKFALLEPRQEGICVTYPDGVICSETTCCPQGDHCCPDVCCENSDKCYGADECCPNNSQTCGGKTCCKPGASCCSSSPIGCCPGGYECCKSTTSPCCPPNSPCCGDGCCNEGETCCGDTCCLSGFFCERGECVDSQYKSRVARFEYDEKKNGAILRNMCNGLRGKNTMELTYSGKLSSSQQRTKRGAAGCTSGYCKKLGQPGLNSCDEFPFASTDEGGDTLDQMERAITCVPGPQNSYQGGILGSLIKNQNLQQGDKFIVSIDCDQVLGSINGGKRELGHSLVIRDGAEPLQSSGVIGSDDVYPPNLTHQGALSYVIAGFGDLGPGVYNATAQVMSGSVTGAFMTDNLGNNLSTFDNSLRAGQSQDFSFTVADDGEIMGVGLILATTDKKTNVSWTFNGILNPETSPSPSISGSPNSPSGNIGGSSAGAALSVIVPTSKLIGAIPVVMMVILMKTCL